MAFSHAYSIGRGGACPSGWLQISTYILRQVYNFGPTQLARPPHALLNYTATPNLINLEIVLARSVGRTDGRSVGWSLAGGGSVSSYLENSKRVILVPRQKRRWRPKKVPSRYWDAIKAETVNNQRRRRGEVLNNSPITGQGDADGRDGRPSLWRNQITNLNRRLHFTRMSPLSPFSI